MEETHGGQGDSMAGGESGNISVNVPSSTTTEYLRANGSDGYKIDAETFITKCAIGGSSVLGNGSLSVGLGVNRGSGGDQHGTGDNEFAFECGHDYKSVNGSGGCLYILSTETYRIVRIDVPDSSYRVTVAVTGDVVPGGQYVDEEATRVGTIEGYGDMSFIVRNDARVSYTVSKEHYNPEPGYFFVGKTDRTGVSNNVTVNALNKSNNTQTVNIKLSKQILTHTITSSGATIKVSGKFMANASSDGTVTKTSATGTDSVTVYVWSGEPSIKLTSISKTYYNTLSNVNITAGASQTQNIGLDHGNAIVTTNGSNTTVTLPKTRYYATLSQTGEITFKKGTRDIVASWDSWTTDERNKASGTSWKYVYEGFEVTDLTKGDTNITYGSLQYSNNLPSRMTVTLSNFTETHIWTPFGNIGYVWYDKTFKIGTVYVEINN